MKKILYLSYDGLTDPLGQSQVLPYLIGLSRESYQITILSVEKKANFQLNYSLIKEITEKNQLDWHYIFYTKKPPVFSTIYDLQKLKRKARRLHLQNSFDVVHCRSYIAALVGLYLKKKFSLKFIFDMRGFWADERVEGGLWNLKNPLFAVVYQYFKKKEKEFLQKADYTISLTNNARKEIQKWNLPACSPIQVIPCCVDMDLFNYELERENERESVSKQLAISPSDFVISYLGSLGTWYMLDEMLFFFNRLLLLKPFAKFLFITPDNPQTVIQKAAKIGILERQILVRKANRVEVPRLLAQSRLSVFFVKPSFSKKASSPTKMGEILAMGIPIIANKNIGDNEYLFAKYPCGVLVKDFSEDSFDTLLLNLDNLLQIPKEELRKAALEYFGLEKGISLYREVYEKLEV